MTISRLFVANRGEIAVRVIRAARELGIETVQAVSKADHDMLAAKLADEKIEIGPPQATKSYLKQDSLVQAALTTHCDAVHPGYGFLAENADFARAVTDAGLAFIGPSAETIKSMGDKAAARAIADEVGVATVPGSAGRISVADADELVETIGVPIMIKAAAGGGGRGIRVANTKEELRAMMPLAGAEATAAFGDGGLYLERFIPRARHIEVQIIGDGENVVHIFERECSVQRRRQKIWEEAPAACLREEERETVCSAAVKIAKHVGYKGAGTIEFLFDDETREFFFIEMNTRIQVEHPVSEMITGIDIVKEMIKVAGGSTLTIAQADVTRRGHAIECRINAEDPANNFRPAPGEIQKLSVPQGEHVRFDCGIYEGYTVPPFYDSLLGKLVVWGGTRDEALARLEKALAQMSVEGIPTTIALHRALVGDAEVRMGRVHTRWLEQWLERHQRVAQESD
jgi:acetyl-CoA carboxylase biotin carboxylase subunit